MVNGTEIAAEIAPYVLVLTDFSDTSNEALRWAEHLAIQHNSNLKVLYPYRLTQLGTRDDLLQFRREVENEARNRFAKLTENVLLRDAPRYDFSAEVGFINDRIYSHTRKNEILAVVMSKRMANANGEALNELLEHLAAPLLIVPGPVHDKTSVSTQLDVGS